VKRPVFLNFTRRLLPCCLLVGLLRSVAAGASPDDNWDPRFGAPGADGPVWSISVHGQDVYVAGTFTQIGGVPANNIAKWNGTNWSALADGLTGGLLPEVHALVFIGEDLFAGGFFTQAGGILASNIAKWDGTNWTALSLGTSWGVRAMAASAGTLYVGGSFSSAGEISANNIAKWDGTKWEGLGEGVTWPYPGAAVDSVVVSGPDLYVGGRFRTAGGIAATNIARWDGTTWFPLDHGLRNYDGPGSENGVVRALVVRGSDLYAGGGFSVAGRVSAAGIAKWNGNNWSALTGGVNHTWALALSGTTDLYVGGFFNTAGPISAMNIAKWSGLSWENLGSGTASAGGAGSVRALAASGTDLFVGGFFTLAGGKLSSSIALWHIPHTLSIQQVQDNVVLSWPATGTNFVLEAACGVPSSNWSPVTQPVIVHDGQCVVTNALGRGNQFYRLRRR